MGASLSVSLLPKLGSSSPGEERCGHVVRLDAVRELRLDRLLLLLRVAWLPVLYMG